MAPVVSPGITEMVALSRERKGLEIFTVRQAARGLFRALRRGRTVALMLDVPEAGPTVVVPFCGGPVRCSAVPARLAAVTGAAIIPVTCRREGRGWALEIHPAVSLEGDDAAVIGARRGAGRARDSGSPGAVVPVPSRVRRRRRHRCDVSGGCAGTKLDGAWLAMSPLRRDAPPDI